MTTHKSKNISSEIDDFVSTYCCDYVILPSGTRYDRKKAKQVLTQLLQDAESVSRIRTLTDVDDLNLLNDSDVWHDFYLSEVEQYKKAELKGNKNDL